VEADARHEAGGQADAPCGDLRQVEKTFLNELYKDTKAHLPDGAADLHPQFPLIRDATRASTSRVRDARLRGRRSDRTLCAAGLRGRRQCPIVSSDKDLMQLVNDCVIMYDTMKDKKIGIPPR